MPFHLGLLVPRSGLYPTIGFDLQAGLRAGLAEHAGIEISIENINYGEKDGNVYATCEKLLLQGHKVIAAYINAPTAVTLQPLFEASESLLIVLDSGYQFPTHEGRLPNVIFLSLEGMLCCRLAATNAIRDGRHQLAFATSYYDAGYRAPYTMAQAVGEKGHAIAFNHITSLKRAEFTLEALAAWVQTASSTDSAILAAFCGDMSTDFLLHLSRFEKAPIALYGSPYMAEEKWLSQSVYPGLDFYVWVPWDRSLPLAANETFTTQLNGRKPTLFSMLGYEAGLLATAVQESGLHGAAAAAAMTAGSFETPRGLLWIDPATQQSKAPIYKVRIGRDDATGLCRLVGSPEPVINDLDEQWALLQNDIASFRGLPSSNWVNAYPCIE